MIFSEIRALIVNYIPSSVPCRQLNTVDALFHMRIGFRLISFDEMAEIFVVRVSVEIF